MTVGDDVFLGRVGHDLRGELATMVAGVHYLLRYEANLNETSRQMLERVNGAGQRLKRLLDELEYAPWIGGGTPRALATEPLGLLGLVEAAVGRLERSTGPRGVTVDVQTSGELPDLVADPELLAIAVEYAIDFAVARTPRGGVTRVLAEIVDGAPRLTIRDEGGAVDPALLERALEPFVEKELVLRPEPGARRRERLGLGLAITRGILAAHGGDLRVEADPSGSGLVLACALGGR